MTNKDIITATLNDEFPDVNSGANVIEFIGQSGFTGDGSTSEVLDSEHVQRSTLRIRTRQWMLGRMSPTKYGDKLDVSHGGNVIVEIKK